MGEGPEYDYLYKVVLIGDSGVGKSNLLSRFTRNEFSLETKSTIGVEFATRSITVDSKTIKAQIWDTAGQERFLTLSSVYYRGAHGVLLVYSVVDRNTFLRTNLWIGNIDKYCTDVEPPSMILVGNKADLRPEGKLPAHCVSHKEGAELAQSYGIPFFETSAKDGKGVEEAFYSLLDLLLDRISIPSLDQNKLPLIQPSSGCCTRQAGSESDESDDDNQDQT